MGFSGRIERGSVASRWQSSIGNVDPGSLFSIFQCVGARRSLLFGPYGIFLGMLAFALYAAYQLGLM